MSTLKFLYRKAQIKDLEEIKRIEVDSNLSPWSVKDYEEEIEKNPYFFVSEYKGEVTGFILVRLITNLQNYPEKLNKESHTGKIEAEILNIGVSKNFRRRNIGTNLMKLILEKVFSFKNYSIILDVRVSNNSAIAFYRTFGFKIISSRKNLYSNPMEDGYFMKLEKN